MSRLTKKERDTEIYYNQSGDPVQIRTHDTKLIRKLTALSEEYPELCQLTEEDECSGSYYDVNKNCISIHVIRPYPEERRRKQREWAKENGIKGNQSRTVIYACRYLSFSILIWYINITLGNKLKLMQANWPGFRGNVIAYEKRENCHGHRVKNRDKRRNT